MTSADITTICSAIGLGVTFLATEHFKFRREKMLREQTRLDLDAAESRRITAIEEVRREGGRREERLTAKVDQVQKATMAGIRISREAIETSNGIKTALMENGVKLIVDDSIPSPNQAP